MRRALIAVIVFLSPACLPAQDQAGPESDAPATGSGELPLDEIRTFTEVFAKVKNDYVEPVDDRALLESAIRGMLEGLDPHSTYLDQEAYRDLQEGTTGEFGGLGIEVGMEDGFIKVISPIDDTPAQRAGVKPGDIIIRLDDTPVKGMSLNDAVDRMRGKPGTQIRLTIIREGEDKPIHLTLTRDVVKVKSVRSRMLEPGFSYLRVSNFQTHTAEDLRDELERLLKDNGAGLKGAVLDLRNNPGGILSAAVGVADLFLESGMIVYTEGRVKDSKLKFTAKPTDVLAGAPMVVLVNEGSASASEIVAGALQDQKRAIIMGQKTFGKGSVQTILPMANDAALKLTTARYYTPSGRSIQAAGIVPDIAIKLVRIEDVADAGDVVTEADLSGHLKNGSQETEPQEGKDAPQVQQAPDPQKEVIPEASPADGDYALYEALNVLKGLVIAQKKAD
ncbi:MAG: S41 family peptidase [Gammaproteobacteria bacterium]|nr:S41 family peptidase [Gammaproteobacteria bacterium]